MRPLLVLSEFDNCRVQFMMREPVFYVNLEIQARDSSLWWWTDKRWCPYEPPLPSSFCLEKRLHHEIGCSKASSSSSLSFQTTAKINNNIKRIQCNFNQKIREHQIIGRPDWRSACINTDHHLEFGFVMAWGLGLMVAGAQIFVMEGLWWTGRCTSGGANGIQMGDDMSPVHCTSPTADKLWKPTTNTRCKTIERSQVKKINGRQPLDGSTKWRVVQRPGWGHIAKEARTISTGGGEYPTRK